MIPIIRQLNDKGHKVILGGDGAALNLLKNEFPQLDYIVIRDHQIRFKYGIQSLSLITTGIKVLFGSIREHLLLKRILKHQSVDVIISDNRYGIYHTKCQNIFVTHQVFLKLPRPFVFLERLTHLIIRSLIRNFDECWIPDFKGSASLAGALSQRYALPIKTSYIGPLSKFSSEIKTESNSGYHIAVVLSGPEPQRSKFQKQITSLLKTTNHNCLIIEGRILNTKTQQTINNITIVPHLPSQKLQQIIIQTPLIICRSGYSSIMDLHQLKKRALLIPTPGQTEQEYLSKHLINKHHHCSEKKITSEIIEKTLNEFCTITKN